MRDSRDSGETPGTVRAERDAHPDKPDRPGDRPAAWREGWRDGADSLYTDRPRPAVRDTYRTLTYEVDGRIARITFNRPERGNAITPDTPLDLAAAVERADLDPAVHVIVVSGRGKGFCGGYDLDLFAEHADRPAGGPSPAGTVLDPVVQARNHDPARQWDPMADFAMMSRFNKGFAALLHADKPTVAKLHGFCVAGGTDIALYCDLIVAADDTKIGYPPTRVWGVPAAGMWAHRIGDQRAKRLLLTGDCISGAQAAEWGLAVESAPAEELDAVTERLLDKIAMMPVNQLMMVKLALNSALLAQGVQNSATISTVFDGISRHTREGYAFQERAMTAGFREAVRERDEAFRDHRRTQFESGGGTAEEAAP
ncbi:crotonase/enoyl-CoA hydratase family protein [Streptomyces sp. NA04227]|uniref:crotonase/enoyl-CoA hydratase family protein n=1 Tax=Streptomyces sp. NA04227 TaxID=2742136 RepID=UPI001590FA7B|nr:crotonase/enoyl-CoA hydratase family protein [Streptomyces sp. NA04227]QKW08408.1 crotonase/enoyl-CoA hydratase family protein [Streptomyces sp. NA04227]